jgi:hypothetical protein
VGVVPLSGGVPLTSGGVAPIATQEHLEEELEEDNCEGNDNDNSNIGKKLKLTKQTKSFSHFFSSSLPDKIF